MTMATAERPIPINNVYIPGASRLDVDSQFALDIVSGRAFRKYQPELLSLAIAFDVGRLHPTRPLAEKMMSAKMVIPANPTDLDLETPSIMFLVEKTSTGDNLKGLATQQTYIFDLQELGRIPFFYTSVRILGREVRGGVETRGGNTIHFGRLFIQQGRLLNLYATWGGHRSNSLVASDSYAHTGIFEEGKLFPWDRPFNESSIARRLLLRVWERVGNRDTQAPNVITGRCIDDYDEPNMENPIRPEEFLSDRFKQFREKWYANGHVDGSRDSQYALGELKGAA